MDDLQKQLNKVIEENARLRSTQPRSPTTPTSPLPVIFEPPATEGEVEEEEPAEVYAQVDMSKVSLRGVGVSKVNNSVIVENFTFFNIWITFWLTLFLHRATSSSPLLSKRGCCHTPFPTAERSFLSLSECHAHTACHAH